MAEHDRRFASVTGAGGTTSRWQRLAAVVVTVMLVAAACGGDSDGDDGNGDGAADATPDDTAEPAGDPTDDDGSAAGGDDGADEPAPTVEASETLTIGLAYPDVSAFATLNEKFSIGDPEEQAAAVLDGWRRDGTLPINGYDIELVFRKYAIINTDDKLGVCTSFAQDDDVFAVVSGRDFTVGADCLATRYQIPVIDLMGAPPSTYERGAPWFFTLRADEAEVLRAYVQWGTEMGVFDGATIGVFWDTRSEEAVDALREALGEAGHEIAVDIPSDGEGVGSPQDQIAVERFAAEGVDVAVLLVGTSSVTNFMSFAEAQDYRPAYPGLEWASQIGDVASASLPQEQYDGTVAMTISRVGELSAGTELTPQATACIDNYERYAGRDLEASVPETAEWAQILYTCDLLSLLREGLANAGPDITRESLVAGLEQVQGFPLAAWGDLSWGPDDHSGVQQFRTIEWSTDCLCWTATGDMTDFAN